MNPIFSIFPKFYTHLTAAGLAELVHQVGLDTTNVVIRDRYWVSPRRLSRDLPAFRKAMEKAGLKVTFATAGFTPDEIVFSPAPLAVLADNGITQFRMGYFRIDGGDVRQSYVVARGKLETMLYFCAEAKVRAVYQLHHGTLVPSGSAAFGLVNGLDSQSVGVELDPGNQVFEGHERPELSVGLLGEYLRAVGVKDAACCRDPQRGAEPGKGWKIQWTTLDEGVTDWYDLVRALHRAGFDGHFVFMPFYDEGNPDEMTRKLKRDVAYLRKVVADVEAEAAAAASQVKPEPGKEV